MHVFKLTDNLDIFCIITIRKQHKVHHHNMNEVIVTSVSLDPPTLTVYLPRITLRTPAAGAPGVPVVQTARSSTWTQP